MTAPAIELEQQAIEAATKAIEEHQSLLGYDARRMAREAISAFLAVSGVGRNDTHEYGWLVEDSRNHPSGIRYRTWGDFGPEWTNDPNKALRFARREDAEMFARDDEDAWHIVEHMWPTIDAAMAREGE